jgi:hypothetical protein
MKKQIRRGVFETNSSSVHSITMCSQDEYSKWVNGDLIFDKDSENFITKEEAIKELKPLTHWKTGELLYAETDWEDEEVVDTILRKNSYYTEQSYWDDIDYETFSDSYTTVSGEKVKAFGYYGEDR